MAQLWAVADVQFTGELVGGKGLHLAELRAALPAGVCVPPSAALPFGAYERCVGAAEGQEGVGCRMTTAHIGLAVVSTAF